MKATPEHLVREEIRQLSAYHVPPAAGMIKLDAMENPYAWPESLRQTWLDKLKTIDVNRYPDPAGNLLTQQLREMLTLPEAFGILLGNGSDELIQIIAMSLARPGSVLLSVEPGFVMYRMISIFAGMRYVGLPLQSEDFSLNADVMLQAIEQQQPAVIFLAYPNNPTGNHFDRAVVEKIIAAAPGLVVIDEAYEPFAADSFLPDLGRFPNLLVMRTLSKFGLAGLRLGYLCGAHAWLNEFNKLRLPYNINTLTQITATLALEHQSVFVEQAANIRRERAMMLSRLEAMSGLQVFHSDANFILFRTPAGQASRIFDSLKHAGVLIKNLSPAGGLLQDCLRVTVGLPEENQVFLSALEKALMEKATSPEGR